MKISVVTICFNAEEVIEKTILSVVYQTYRDIEYIIIDGGSRDNTMNIVNSYKDSIDVVVSEPDEGIYDAMNKGIKCSTGDWIIFMNAGDSFYNESVVERFVPLINKDTIIAHGDIMVVAEHFKYHIKPTPIERMKHRMAVKHQATFVKTEFHKQHPFDSWFRSSGDYDFFYKAYYNYNVNFQYIPICVANFAIGGTSNVNFRRSFRENLHIWGKENDYLFRFKQEMMFIVWDLLRTIRLFFYSEKKRVEHARKKAERIGRVYDIDEVVNI